jgi:hypothetical protein
MSAFTDVVHKVANVGEHVVEYVEGHAHVTLNGALVGAQDLIQLIQALQEIEAVLSAAAA